MPEDAGLSFNLGQVKATVRFLISVFGTEVPIPPTERDKVPTLDGADVEVVVTKHAQAVADGVVAPVIEREVRGEVGVEADSLVALDLLGDDHVVATVAHDSPPIV